MTTTATQPPTYYCPGHATTCPACLDPDFGGCDGHGVISYCEGTCASAREYLEQDIMAGRERVVDSTDSICFEVMACDGSSCWEVVFEGPDAEARALAYWEAHSSGFALHEVISRPFSYAAFPRMAAKVHPICHHGMSEDLCMDPIGEYHFGTREQEMAYSW